MRVCDIGKGRERDAAAANFALLFFIIFLGRGKEGTAGSYRKSVCACVCKPPEARKQHHTAKKKTAGGRRGGIPLFFHLAG